MNAILGASPNPRLAELRSTVAQHEDKLRSYRPLTDVWQVSVDACESGRKRCRTALVQDCKWLAGGLAGIGLGIACPGVGIAALIGFGCFVKGWRDSFGHLMEGRQLKSEQAYYQKKLDDSNRSLAEMQKLLADARTALANGEAEEQVRALNDGMKRTNSIFETDKDVQFAGVRLKKRGG